MSNIKLNKIFKTACIASDHAGFKLKEDIKDYLVDNNFSVFVLCKFYYLNRIIVKMFH